MRRIHLVVAARPNFMKIAPLWHAFSRHHEFEPTIVHTGQHYDYHMSTQFFEDLKLPAPTINLEAGSGSHATQTAAVLVAYERYLLDNRPDLVVVPGDVNSTLACALASAKLNIPVAHLEAGLRSRDMSMPEEINRILTDSMSSILWTPSQDASDNLVREGTDPQRISLVGNCMIDSLYKLLPVIESRQTWKQFDLPQDRYILATLHRPGNVDDPKILSTIVKALERISREIAVILPLHPRTREQLQKQGLLDNLDSMQNIFMIAPLGYVDFLSLVHKSHLVITDSGGLQEETTVLGIPCLTVRPNTERPITCTAGTNRLVSAQEIENAVLDELDSARPAPCPPAYWDGHTADRILADLDHRFQNPLGRV
ncbi:MAG: UDP-N-acetylglucosamine 2-epimerase (non-hydrolyzing) [Pseudodesulfovibrio sp.]|nr:UDP-N-acetylglucosamine 2-epimerase (non-hydrolyzing) [Pseudodesulfovibrio sp.]